MPELEYFLAAESHSIYRDTNSISIFNVFNEIKANEGLPFTVQRIVLISCWLSSQDEITQKIDNQASFIVKRPGDDPQGPINFNFTSDVQFQHLILGCIDVEINHAGMIEFELLLNGQHQATHRIAVVIPDSE